jgi:hypothetical protein
MIASRAERGGEVDDAGSGLGGGWAVAGPAGHWNGMASRGGVVSACGTANAPAPAPMATAAPHPVDRDDPDPHPGEGVAVGKQLGHLIEAGLSRPSTPLRRTSTAGSISPDKVTPTIPTVPTPPSPRSATPTQTGSPPTCSASAAFRLPSLRSLAGLRAVQDRVLMPGAIFTNLQRHIGDQDSGGLSPEQFKTTRQGAATSVLLATSPRLQGIGGRYFVDCNETETVDSRTDTLAGVARHALMV